MSRKHNANRLDLLSTFIQENPNQKPATIAQELGLDNKTVMRALPQLEERGDMLQEDDQGRLSWFGRKK